MTRTIEEIENSRKELDALYEQGTVALNKELTEARKIYMAGLKLSCMPHDVSQNYSEECARCGRNSYSWDFPAGFCAEKDLPEWGRGAVDSDDYYQRYDRYVKNNPPKWGRL